MKGIVLASIMIVLAATAAFLTAGDFRPTHRVCFDVLEPGATTESFSPPMYRDGNRNPGGPGDGGGSSAGCGQSSCSINCAAGSCSAGPCASNAQALCSCTDQGSAVCYCATCV